MIVEVQADGAARAPARPLLVAALALVALAAALAPDEPRRLSTTLALPDGEGDVQLYAIPERLVNDPQPANQSLVVRVRGTVGIAADAKGAATLSWSERGYFYRLTSGTLGVPELARVAARLR